MAARTPANTSTPPKENINGPTVSPNVKVVQEDIILINQNGACHLNKVLLQGQ